MSRKMTVIIALLVSGWYACILVSFDIPWKTEQHAASQAQPMRLIQIAEQEADGSYEQIQEKDNPQDEQRGAEPEEEIPAESEIEEETEEAEETQESDDQPIADEQPERESTEDSSQAQKEPAESPPAEEAAQQEIMQETEMEYRDVEDVTTAPQFPIELLLEKLVYPPLARRQGREGVVLLELFVSAQGEVERVEVLEDPGYGMGAAARRAFQGITASPAEIRGEGTAVRMRYPVRFSLNN